MEAIDIVIPGDPVAKGRPRLGKYGTFTPRKTKDYEDKIRLIARGEMTRSGLPLFEGPLLIYMTVVVRIPDSWSKAKKEMAMKGEIQPTCRPDLDNYLKSLDALNGVVWQDDSQVVEIRARKKYGEVPMMVLRVINSK